MTSGAPVRGSVPASTRAGDPTLPVVVDLAFGDPRIHDPDTGIRRPAVDVRSLLESADEMTVVRDGRRSHLRQAWQQAFAELLGPAAGARPLLVGHPSTWGARRSSSLGSVGGPGPVTLLPRAVLIARSHADITVGRCAVVETTHLPRVPHDPARPRRREWDVQILDRTPAGWAIGRSAVLDAQAGEGRGPAAAGVVESVVDDTVEAVFVDGDDPAEVEAAIRTITAHAIAGRVVRVDRDLLVRLGRRTGAADDDAAPLTRAPRTPAVDAASSTSRRRPLVLGAVGALAVVALAVGIGVWQNIAGGQEPAGPTTVAAQLGRAELAVPGQWRQTPQDPPGDATADADTARAVFVSEDDGGRIIAVVTDLRPGSTRESVARSLRNRIEQRGDSVVTEFSAATRFGGREVVSYRESPASGSAIRWYVVVEDDLQVSIGCQAGSAGEPVDAACTQAVRSVRVR